jgi:hypothetical protein
MGQAEKTAVITFSSVQIANQILSTDFDVRPPSNSSTTRAGALSHMPEVDDVPALAPPTNGPALLQPRWRGLFDK